MNKFNKYGIYRSLEPINSLPRASWKLDNTMEIRDNEILIDVKQISVNEVGFNQIYEECHGSKVEISKYILEIIQQRGKLHNPVTGTGGAMCGTVVEMGKNYPNEANVQVGDTVMSYSSITLIPMQLDRIIDIDFYTGQIKVKGKAILYSNYPILKKPEELSSKIVFSIIDHAGTAAETARITKEGDSVMIMGANGKIGLACAFAAKEKIGKSGKLYGIVNTQERKNSLSGWKLFDEVIVMDATNMEEIMAMDEKLVEGFDQVINCINYPNTEFLSIVLCKEKGVIYFSTLGANTPLASLTAEGVNKDVKIVHYKGIVQRHVDEFMDLMRRNPELQKMLEAKFNKYKYSRVQDEITTPVKAEQTKKQENNKTKPQKFVNGEEFVFNSAKIKAVMDSVIKVANYDSNVMIYGASGTGKEVIAKLIHDNSARVIFPYVKINCASIPETLLESELFGYEKGAFTGANPKGKIGYWEKANNGTLFLDEIGETSPAIQVKLLRAIQENEIYRIGSAQFIKTNVRIVAATNKDLKQMVKDGAFREDLYYRLNVYPVTVPKLSERREDIVPLIKVFNTKYNKKFNTAKIFSKEVLKYMESLEWEGNIRELQNFVQRVMIEAGDNVIYLSDVYRAMGIHHENKEFYRQIEGIDHTTLPVEELLKNDIISFDDTMEEVERHILTIYKSKYGSTRKIAAALKITQNKAVRLLNKYNI